MGYIVMQTRKINREKGYYCQFSLSYMVLKYFIGRVFVKRKQTLKPTRHLRKRNWVAFMIVIISELEKRNGELYMPHGNLDIKMVDLRFSLIHTQ